MHSRAVVACLTPPSSLGMPQFTTALEWKKGRRPAFPAKISTRVLSLPMPPSTGKGFRFPSSLVWPCFFPDLKFKLVFTFSFNSYTSVFRWKKGRCR